MTEPRFRRSWLGAPVGALALVALSAGPTAMPAFAAPSAATLTVGSLTLTACSDVEVEGSQAWCGSLARPWNPAAPNSGSLDVGFVLTLPTGAAQAAAAAPRDARTSAIVALQGGPGWGGITSGSDFAKPFGDQLRTRGLLVFDQRGTGKSAPVDCDTQLTGSGTWRAGLAACAAALGDHADLFGTSIAADDLAAIISALGLGPSNIYGVSYGTFFAQVFAGRHPELTRTLLLDSAYPAFGESGWVETIGPSIRDALDLSCRRAPSCARLPGTSAGRLAQVLTLLRRSPVRVTAPSPDGRRTAVHITPDALADAIIDAGYGGTTYAGVDASLRAALAGDWLPLGRLLNESQGSGSRPDGDGASDSNQGLMYAVICHDYPQIIDTRSQPAAREAQYQAAIKAGQAAHPRLYAPFTVTEFLRSSWWDQESCLDWPVSTRLPAQPPTPPSGAYGTQPTLVLSGDLDLVTTVREGAIVASQFPNARQVIVASGTHGLTGNDCIDGLIQDFIIEPQAVVNGEGGACAAKEPPVRLVSSYPRTSRGLSLTAAAARTAADILDRWRNGGDPENIRGYGLRGGSWKAVGYDTVRITLKQVKLFDDVPVSGSVIWDEENEVHATLTAKGRTFKLQWNDATDPEFGTSERVG